MHKGSHVVCMLSGCTTQLGSMCSVHPHVWTWDLEAGKISGNDRNRVKEKVGGPKGEGCDCPGTHAARGSGHNIALSVHASHLCGPNYPCGPSLKTVFNFIQSDKASNRDRDREQCS